MARYIDADALIKNIANITDLRRLSTKTVGIAIFATTNDFCSYGTPKERGADE